MLCNAAHTACGPIPACAQDLYIQVSYCIPLNCQKQLAQVVCRACGRLCDGHILLLTDPLIHSPASAPVTAPSQCIPSTLCALPTLDHMCCSLPATCQSFFTAWWSRQSPKVQDEVRELVAQGRLDFINGGWVQHDEAATHYVAMIDQTTRGHR